MLKYHRFLVGQKVFTLELTMFIAVSKKTLVLLLTTFLCAIQSEIREIAHFDEILTYAEADSLILIDIDNTLLEPHPDYYPLGSDQWFSRLLKTDPDFQETLNHYCSTVLTTPMTLVESTACAVIKTLVERSLVLGFTMRSIVLAPCTQAQLTNNGILFSPIFDDKGFMVESKEPVMVYHNTIFCQGKKNGLTLFTVLDGYGLSPQNIIMVDDKKSYLESVEQACNQRGIPFIGLRYGYLDEKVRSFLTSFDSIIYSS